jgi:transposase-like protein
MEKPKTSIEELRLALETSRPSGRGGYPPALRVEAKRYVARRASEGASRRRIAEELGVKPLTVKEWAQDLKERAGRQQAPDVTEFARVAVIERGTELPLVVHTRQGLRIDGLSFEDVVTLLGKLS